MVNLGDVAHINPRLSAALHQAEPVSFVPMASLSAEEARIVSAETRPYSEVSKGYTPFQNGDILVAKITPCFENGKIAQANLPLLNGFGSTEFHVIRPREESLDGRYVHHFLRQGHIRIEGERRMTGSGGQRRVPASFLSSLKIFLPRLEEQRRIAAILDQADALRAKRRETLAQLDNLTQAIFSEMFGDPVNNPKNWPLCSLGDLTEKITDGEHINPEFSASGMPIIMAGNVLENSIDIEGAKKVEPTLGHRFRRKCNPEQGDLLVVSRGATIGRMCPVNVDDIFCLMGSVILIKVKRDKLKTAFVTALLKHPIMRSALYKTSGSSAQQAIYLKDLKNLFSIQPPINLQNQFSELVLRIDELRASHRKSLLELDSMFASLQHRAFRGEL